METQDWKSNLGESLSSKQIFRQVFIDKQAEAFCKKWASYVSEFADFKANYTLDILNPKQSGIPNQLITKSFGVMVEFQSSTKYPFKLSLLYKSNAVLVIHYPTAIDMGYCFKNTLDNSNVTRILEKEYEPVCYKWTQEGLEGSEIHEEGYVLQIINKRFMDWVDMQETNLQRNKEEELGGFFIIGKNECKMEVKN